MSAGQHALILTLALVAVLVVVTMAGLALKANVARGEPHGGIDTLNAHVRAWWWMTLYLALALVAGRGAVILLFAFVSFTALREYVTLAPTRRADHWALVMSFFVALPFQYFLVWLDWYAMFTVFIPVHVFLALPVLLAVRGDPRDFTERTAGLQWGLMVTVYCISHVPALLMLDIPGYEGRNAFLIVFLVLVVQSGDVLRAAYGRLPGLGAAAVLAGALWWITPFAPWEAALVGLVLCLMGLVGRIVLGAIRRDRGARAWGKIFEGSGGMLDRVDSVCFSAPIFFHVLRYWFVP